MKGNENQIKWAEDIKNQNIDLINRAASVEFIAPEPSFLEPDAPSPFTESDHRIAKERIAAIMENNDAGFWIDHRNNILAAAKYSVNQRIENPDLRKINNAIDDIIHVVRNQ